jgi:hypothetical protein
VIRNRPVADAATADEQRGSSEVPLWLWCVSIGYLGVLFIVALWATVERMRPRWAIVEPADRPSDPGWVSVVSEARERGKRPPAYGER